MDRAHLGLSATLLVTAVVTISCGGGTNSDRMLESITISPAVATVPGKQVQFVATGTFSASPTTVTPLAVNWGGPVLPMLDVSACTPNGCSGIDAQGLAICGQTWTGMVTITASAPRDPKLPLYTQNVPMVSATARLVCP
jgi:hypothetical protein